MVCTVPIVLDPAPHVNSSRSQRTLTKNFSITCFQIRPSATNKYLFMYISKAQQILAQSATFRICQDDSNLDVDDLEDFAFVKSRLDKEKGECQPIGCV